MDQGNIKQDLATAYQILSFLKMDDHTYTHLSARAEDPSSYYIYPFGLRFEEVTIDNLLKVDLDGTILHGNEYQYNRTGYVIHGSIYKARSDISCIFHLHTNSMVAVSALKDGLLPISQWALHFYDRVAYHDYASLALDESIHGDVLVEDLGQKNIMFLRNHGTIICASNIQEAMFFAYHLEQACVAQLLAMGTKSSLIFPAPEICKKAVYDLLSFEKDLGKRDWEAWKRVITRIIAKSL